MGNIGQDEKWWESLLNLVREPDEYIGSISVRDFGSFALNERGLKLFRQWKDGAISKDEVIRTIRREHGLDS